MGVPARRGPECGTKYLAPPLRLGLAFVASAVMLTVIQAPVSFSALAWVSLVPFILACSPESRPRNLVPVAYIVSVCYWLGNLYWVFPITLAGWLAFCLYTAVLWPVVALCLRYCRAKRIPLFLAAGVLFVGAERLQGFFLGGFFWRFLAHSQYHNITLIQIADIFGAAGLSFLIAMVNGLLAELILDARHSMGGSLKSPRLRGDKLAPAEAGGFGDGLLRCKSILKIAVVCAAVIATVAYGRWRIKQSDKFVEPGPLVASLQSNVPQSVKRGGKASDVIFDELLQKSKAGAEVGAELIIWPETIVQAELNKGYLIYLDESSQPKFFDRALSEHSKDNAYLLVGATAATVELQGTDYVVTEKYNSAFLYRPDGQQDQKRYDKIHPILFSEVLPFRKSCPPLFRLLMKFNPYGYDHSIDAGSEYTVFEMTSEETQNSKLKTQNCGYRFSTIICYEATLPAIVRGFVLDQRGQKQIDWLVNISNDGWFVRFEGEKVYPSTELPQHAAVCVFRAVENRLAVVRSVNTGISCLIDSLGRIRDGYIAASADLPITAMERKGMAGWFVDEMPIDKRVTVFSRYGQWLDFCCVVCLVLLIMVPFTTKLFRIRKRLLQNCRTQN